MKESSVTLAYFVEWKVSVVHSALCAVFAHLLPHCDKLSHLPAECYFSLRAWQHLCSLCTSFLSQLTDNVLVAYHHKHECVCPWTHTHTHRDRWFHLEKYDYWLSHWNVQKADKSSPASDTDVMVLEPLRLHAVWSGKWPCTGWDLLWCFSASGWHEAGADSLTIMCPCYWALNVSIAVGKRQSHWWVGALWS